MISNEKIKKIIIILIVGYFAVCLISFIGGGIMNIIDPIENHYSSPDYTTSDSGYSSSSVSSSSGSHSHYSVTTDPYELAYNDPGAYYDHYEYGDNYEIDDYLESEGYD